MALMSKSGQRPCSRHHRQWCLRSAPLCPLHCALTIAASFHDGLDCWLVWTRFGPIEQSPEESVQRAAGLERQRRQAIDVMQSILGAVRRGPLSRLQSLLPPAAATSLQDQREMDQSSSGLSSGLSRKVMLPAQATHIQKFSGKRSYLK